MSIDAKIRQVKRTPDGDLLLSLEPRFNHATGVFSVAGRQTLLIERPTCTPDSGAAIWGGSDEVMIEVGTGLKRYRRVGYSRLQEDGGYGRGRQPAA
jgi:hypothetical protein